MTATQLSHHHSFTSFITGGTTAPQPHAYHEDVHYFTHHAITRPGWLGVKKQVTAITQNTVKHPISYILKYIRLKYSTPNIPTGRHKTRLPYCHPMPQAKCSKVSMYILLWRTTDFCFVFWQQTLHPHFFFGHPSNGVLFESSKMKEKSSPCSVILQSVPFWAQVT